MWLWDLHLGLIVGVDLSGLETTCTLAFFWLVAGGNMLCADPVDKLVLAAHGAPPSVPWAVTAQILRDCRKSCIVAFSMCSMKRAMTPVARLCRRASSVPKHAHCSILGGGPLG